MITVLFIVESFILDSKFTISSCYHERVFENLNILPKACIEKEFMEIYTIMKSEESVDDFNEHFDSPLLRICLGLTIVSNLIASNILFSFLILFDKYGGDWAKRSLFNRLVQIFTDLYIFD